MRRIAIGLVTLGLLGGPISCIGAGVYADADGGSADARTVGWDAAIDAGPACTNSAAGPACTNSLTCCSNHCVDVLQSPAHCGACDTQCQANQFCADTPGCTALGFSTLCTNDGRIALSSGASADDAVLQTSADAVAAHCGGAVTRSTLNDAVLVDQTSHAPLVGVGNLLLLQGGPFFDLMIRHFEESGMAPLRYVYNSGQNHNQFVESNGTMALDVPQALTTASHDYFLVELFADPVRGALILASYGFDVAGSRAAGWYLVHHLIGAPEPQASWYVVEWTDRDGDLAPSSIDEFALITRSAN